MAIASKRAKPDREAKIIINRINEYYTREPDVVSRFVGAVSKPLDWAASQIPETPDAAITMELKKDAMQPLAAAASQTFNNTSVFEQFAPPASGIADVSKRSVLEMWDVAEKQYSFNAIMTGLSGFGTGLGGPAFVASDVPAVMMSNFRLASQVAVSFGYDWSPEMFPLLLQAMALGMDNVKRRLSHRQAIFIYLRQLQEWVDKNVTEDSVDEFVRNNLEHDNVFARWTARSVEAIGDHLSSKALRKVLPVLGGATNAGINLWMITQTHNAAMAIFAERRLRDQLGDAWVDKLVVEHNGSQEEPPPEAPKAEATAAKPEPTPQAAPAVNTSTASDA
jgi:hypothetical protein